jgi:hypothetical protein
VTIGTIEAFAGGAWVVGSHTYAGAGPYTVTVTVKDDGGATVLATTTAFDPPAGPRSHLCKAIHGRHHRTGGHGIAHWHRRAIQAHQLSAR